VNARENAPDRFSASAGRSIKCQDTIAIASVAGNASANSDSGV
jgi:hypothetical protein